MNLLNINKYGRTLTQSSQRNKNSRQRPYSRHFLFSRPQQLQTFLRLYRWYPHHYSGPEGTCFEAGKFKAELLLPNDYPMSPPKVVFDTKIYHPNIGTPQTILDNLGRICLDILKKNWSPALQIKSVLLSIQSLLSEPNPDDPLNNEAAH